jgi:putative transposase
MNALKEFIHTTKDSRELKRALAVQNTLEGRPWAAVAKELGVGRDFIGKWRRRYRQHGIEGLHMGYQGSRGYLCADAKQQVIAWLHQQASWTVWALQQELGNTYGVQYQSKQSYDALLAEARLSWKKSQKRNPAANPELVQAKRAEIQKKFRPRSRRL